MKNFLHKYSEFIDRMLWFTYVWFWKIITLYLGMVVLEMYLPGVLNYAAPLTSRWSVTLILLGALLAFIQQAAEPIVARLFLHEEDESPAKDKPAVMESAQ